MLDIPITSAATGGAATGAATGAGAGAAGAGACTGVEGASTNVGGVWASGADVSSTGTGDVLGGVQPKPLPQPKAP